MTDSQRARRAAINVLMVVENLSVPADPRVWPEAVALRQAGYNVTVICPTGETRDRERREVRDGVEIRRYALPAGDSPFHFILEWALAFLHTFRLSLSLWPRRRFTVVHVANPPDLFFPLAWLFRLLRAKFIFDQHDLAPEVFDARFAGRNLGLPGRILRRGLILAERYSYRAADLVIVTNETFRRKAMERGHVPPDRIEVIRNGPDLERFQPGEAIRASAGRRVLGFIGTIGHQDGADHALAALDRLHREERHSDVALLFVGDGAAVPALREQARILGITDAVNFTGRVRPEDVPGYLSTIDIGLSPEPSNSLNDCSTLIKVMEYMAMGKPVVAFDLPETRASLGDGGLYARPNSIEDFAACIATLLDDADLRALLGSRGRQRVEQSLHWGRSAAALVARYDRLLFGERV